jgi:hypothetical protein
MYKEYREMSRTDAVESLYQDLASRHRARFRSIHVCTRSLESFGPTGMLKKHLDSPRRRDREDRGHQETLHQAAPHQEARLPPAAPRRQGCHEEDLQRDTAVHFRLTCFGAAARRTGRIGCFACRVFTTVHGNRMHLLNRLSKRINSKRLVSMTRLLAL